MAGIEGGISLDNICYAVPKTIGVLVALFFVTSLSAEELTNLPSMEKEPAQTGAFSQEGEERERKEPIILSGSTFHPPKNSIVLAGSTFHPPKNTIVLAGSTFHPKEPDDDDNPPELAYSFDIRSLNKLVAEKQPIVVHHGYDPNLSFKGYKAEFLGYESLTVARVVGEDSPAVMSLPELQNLIELGPDASNGSLLLHGRQTNYENLKFIAATAKIDFSSWDSVTFPDEYSSLLETAENGERGSLVIGLRPEDVARSDKLEFVQLVDERAVPVLVAGSVSMYVDESINSNSAEWATLGKYWKAVENRVKADRASGHPVLHFEENWNQTQVERRLIGIENTFDKGAGADSIAVTNSISSPFFSID